MHDLATVAGRFMSDKALEAMADEIGDILDLLVDNYIEDFKQEFSILAHGASC